MFLFFNWQLKYSSTKNHIKGFNTLNDFHKDADSKDIQNWVSNRRTRTGDQSLTMANLLSELKKKDEKQITENLKIEFPQYDFENVFLSQIYLFLIIVME
jgi:hypothetical protein